MIVYRITKSKHASDISGLGSALYPGRWNIKGTPVLYTGENREIALLENLVHSPPMLIPKLDIVTIEIPDHSMSTIKVSDLPPNWNQIPAPTILSEIGQQWIGEGKTIALKVPSSIIYTSSNIILNCAHINFSKVRIIDQQPFRFDTRLKR